jgi:hypothetical protein
LAKVPAGTYHLILDAIVTSPVTVTFDLIWEKVASDTQVTLVEWTDSYEPLAVGVDAQPFEYDEPAQAIDAAKDDQFVFRYTANASSATMCYIPDGDGALSKGRIPNITLPQ